MVSSINANSQHFHSTYYVLGTILNSLCHLILYINSFMGIIFSPILETIEPQRYYEVPEVSQLVSGRPQIWTQAVLL